MVRCQAIGVFRRLTHSVHRAEALAKLTRKRVETTPRIGRHTVVTGPRAR
jgi:hypothetical protein